MFVQVIGLRPRFVELSWHGRVDESRVHLSSRASIGLAMRSVSPCTWSFLAPCSQGEAVVDTIVAAAERRAATSDCSHFTMGLGDRPLKAVFW